MASISTLLSGYADHIPMPPVVEGIVLHSASVRLETPSGPLLRASWMTVSELGGRKYYLQAHEARAGYLANGAYVRPITVGCTYGRTRTREGAKATYMALSPTPAGMMLAFDATFRNAAGTVTRTARIVLDTSRAGLRV